MIHELAALIASHHKILVFTGAGISTGSGIPDFRGPQGVWKTEQPVYYQDFMTSVEARREYWRQKHAGAAAFGAASPNDVHRAVVALEHAGKVERVVTQNIDGFHRAAGTDPSLLVEIHGTNALVECQTCGALSDPVPHFDRFSQTGEPPDCECGGFLKPATISFGQSLRGDDLRAAFSAADACDMVLALGSTLSVTPAADVPLRAARRGRPYAVVNRGATEHDQLGVITLRIEGDVGQFVPAAIDLAIGGGDPLR